MRKRIVGQARPQTEQKTHDWLDLESLAVVEVTSEHEEFPIESALIPTAGPGWRAQTAGEQVIRLLFDAPTTLSDIRLVFDEPDRSRTQEFVLRWTAQDSPEFREILRQQFTFSPDQTTEEVEDYRVNLIGLTALELCIVPDIGGGDARASLAQLRLA